MTSFIRRVAGGLTLVEAISLVYAYFDAPMHTCPANGCPGPSFVPTNSIIGLGLALVLLAVGVMGLWGASLAYLGGTFLSAASLIMTGYTVAIVRGYGILSAASDDAVIAAAFALVALIVNAQAMRSKGSISEQANPMNLPVFG